MRYRRKSPLHTRLGQALFPALAVSMLLYFGHHLVGGKNGILALKVYEARLPELEVQAADLNNDKMRLEKRIDRLHPDHIDPDLLDELVRQKLGYVHRDEKIVDLKRF